MTNRGIHPLDPTSAVGQLRALINDTTAFPLVPEEPGYADYAVYGDATLEGLLAIEGGSVFRAAGNIYLQYATEHAAQAVSIKTDDLQIDRTKKAAEYRAIAKTYFERADAADARDADDTFEIIPFGGRAPQNPVGVEGVVRALQDILA